MPRIGLSQILSKAQAFLGQGTPTSVLGIDVGSSSLKVVQLKMVRETVVLETYGEIALGPYANQPVGKTVRLDPEQIAAAIGDLSKEANVTATHAGVAIPFSSSLVSIIDMPKVGESQLSRMIPIEARKYIPVPITEVTLDWFVIPEKHEEDAFDRVQEETEMQKTGREVLIAAIHNETIRNFQTTMETAKIAVSFFEIEIFSTIRSVLGTGIEPVVVVDIGASTTKIYVVERGIVRASHLVSIGSQSLTEAVARSLGWTFEKAERMKREWGLTDSDAYSRDENDRMHEAMLSTLSRIFAEVNRVLLTYGKRYNKNVSQVVFVGGGAALAGLADIATKELNVDTVMAAPFDKVEAPAFLDGVLHSIGPGFAVAVGVAMRRLRQG
ncbi:MAG TPA: type IV pilus assembly protein PilM [Candidatus Paceibacterota bacterium]|nr:type IV pilus assembly protein PilM [Candidatus Paceibacterota bacterium]